MPRGCGEARAVATVGLSEPVAFAAGSPELSSSVSRQRDEAPGRPNLNLPDSPRDRAAQKQALIATKLNQARIARELSRIVGDQSVRRGPDVNPVAATETNSAAGDRILEVAPLNSGQAVEVLKLAVQEGLAVIPEGGGTWLTAGNPISRVDLIVSTRRMKKLIKHEPADLVATAEAGMTLVDLQKHLALAGQWLPIDPPDDGRATLGGIVATGLGGAHSCGFGNPRSFVIGMHLVLADGRAIKAGGNVVKNVAGYDLCKLFTGSYGTLGLLTELTFKLRPLPAETRTVVASGSWSSLLAKGRKSCDELFPVAVELMSPQMAKHLEIEAKPGHYALLVRFAGSARAVVSQTAQCLKLLRSDRDSACSALDEDESIWRKLSAAPGQTSDNVIWRAGLWPGDLASFLNDVNGIETDETSHVAVRWHAGLGDGRVRVIARAPVYHREAVRTLERLRQKVETLGGRLVLETAPAEIKNEFDAWGDFGSARELMKRVKTQLDPQDLFSPGRFAFGT